MVTLLATAWAVDVQVGPFVVDAGAESTPCASDGTCVITTTGVTLVATDHGPWPDDGVVFAPGRQPLGTGMTVARAERHPSGTIVDFTTDWDDSVMVSLVARSAEHLWMLSTTFASTDPVGLAAARDTLASARLGRLEERTANAASSDGTGTDPRLTALRDVVRAKQACLDPSDLETVALLEEQAALVEEVDDPALTDAFQASLTETETLYRSLDCGASAAQAGSRDAGGDSATAAQGAEYRSEWTSVGAGVLVPVGGFARHQQIGPAFEMSFHKAFDAERSFRVRAFGAIPAGEKTFPTVSSATGLLNLALGADYHQGGVQTPGFCVAFDVSLAGAWQRLDWAVSDPEILMGIGIGASSGVGYSVGDKVSVWLEGHLLQMVALSDDRPSTGGMAATAMLRRAF
jgi:hypothetical protein